MELISFSGYKVQFFTLIRGSYGVEMLSREFFFLNDDSLETMYLLLTDPKIDTRGICIYRKGSAERTLALYNNNCGNWTIQLEDAHIFEAVAYGDNLTRGKLKELIRDMMGMA